MLSEIVLRAKQLAAFVAVRVLYYLGCAVIGAILLMECIAEKGRIAMAAYAYIQLSEMVADFGEPSRMRTL